MAKRWRALRRKRLKAIGLAKPPRPRHCEVCHLADPLECVYSAWEKPVAYLCSEHAERNGFCASCGLFWSGIARFDVGPGAGFCDHCWDQIESDMADEFEDDPYDYHFEDVYFEEATS